MSTAEEKGLITTLQLLHYGVRGMHWGVRKERSTSGGYRSIGSTKKKKQPEAVTVTQKGRKLKSTGGAHQPASTEAIKTKELGQIAKKSGFQALSNAQLKAFNERLNLEANANRLDYQTKSAGRRWLDSITGRGQKKFMNTVVDESTTRAGKALVNHVIKKAGKAAAARAAVAAAAVVV